MGVSVHAWYSYVCIYVCMCVCVCVHAHECVCVCGGEKCILVVREACKMCSMM
jgi:hypothetical protein